MAQDSLKSLLTPAARSAIKEMLTSYEEAVLAKAAAHAARFSGELQEISVSDLLASSDDFGKVRRSSIPRRFQTVLVAYALSGFLLAAAGLAYILYENFLIRSDGTTQLVSLVSISGVMIAVSSTALLSYYRFRSAQKEIADRDVSSEYELIGRFLAGWQHFEFRLRDHVATEMGDSVAQGNVNLLLKKLDSERLDPALFEDIVRLKTMRDRVVHERELLDPHELISGISDLDDLERRFFKT